jgi:iron complex outermembrane recepter protein
MMNMGVGTCRGYTAWRTILAVALASAAGPVAAQAAASVSSATSVQTAASAQTLEEIIVTARKRQVELQDAPVAISVMSGQDFARSNIGRLDNFNGYVPGLAVAKNDGAGRVVAIRGVGWETAQNLSTQPSVLVYMDGVYLANPLSFGTELGELQDVEVYRGPQGTEFGQGTTGGAINLIMKKPDFSAISGRVSVAGGSYDLFSTHDSLNIPLADNLAFLGTVQRYTHSGFSEIKGGAADGYGEDDANSYGGSGSLLWKPAASVSVCLSAYLSRSNQHAAAQKSELDPNRDPRQLSQDYPGIFTLQNDLYSASIEWETPWGATFRSLSGLQRLRKNQSEDGDRLNEALTNINISGFAFDNWDVLPFWYNNSDAFSQEFNLTHHDERLDWALGAYYLNHSNYNYFLEATGPAPFSNYLPALLNPSPITLPPFNSVLNFVEARTVTRNDAAIYGQSTFRLNSRLALTAGLRYQRELQKDEDLQFFTIQSTQYTRDHKPTWKIGLDVDLTKDSLLYGLVSTGWKNGGTNPGAINATQVPLTFKPEDVTAFEIGSKNRLLGDRVHFNVVGFYYDYRNQQFTQEDPVPFAGGTGNIPVEHIYGVESEFNWLMNTAWRLDGQVSGSHGRIESHVLAMDVVDFRQGLVPFVIGLFTPQGLAFRQMLGATTDLYGKTPPKLVDLMAYLALTNNHTLGNGALFTSRLDFVHRGEFQARVWNNPLVDTVPAYDTLGLFFQYKPAGSRCAISLSATNLTNRAGISNRFSNPYGVLTTSDEFIPPRQVFAGLTVDF